ncbi:EamA family transporter [Escherichia albertii]|uniref:EamA family transporter n=1 Tax=Escherichia albertii TaxID=208962 RepID=UPI003F73679A
MQALNTAQLRWRSVHLLQRLFSCPLALCKPERHSGTGRLFHWVWRSPFSLLPYSLEMIALTRLPTRTFGTLMSMEPAMAAISGMIFLGETLAPVQLLALGAIIAASMGSTLTVRKESKIKELDIN